MSESSFPPPSPSKATHVRWSIVAAATLMSVLLYLDRYCIPFALTFMQEELGLNPIQAGNVKSAFFLAYSLCQIPSGWLSDRWGGRLMLSIYILTWSLFTCLIGWADGFLFLIAMQLGHGACQAGAYPTSAGLLSQWMPLRSRGLASSVVAFGGRAGAVIAPILTAWLIVICVPPQVSSKLTPDSLFGPKLLGMCESLVPAPVARQVVKPEPHRELLDAIWKDLPEDARQIMLDVAKDQEQARVERDSAKVLADGLNQVLRVPDLVSAAQIQQIKVANEAAMLVAKRDRGVTLTTPETERLNRLVLEALFPAAIRKIYILGWRNVFSIYGIGGMFAALLFWLVVRNRPQEHPLCNTAEVSLIQAGRQATATASDSPAPLNWGRLLSSPGLWLSSVSQFGTNLGWIFVALQLPEYLINIHHVEIIQRGYLTAMPMVGGITGMLLGGQLTDWMRLRWGLRWGRAIPMGLTKFGAAAAFIGCMFAKDAWTATFLCTLVAFFTDLGVAATWAFVQDAGGRYVGVVLGFGNMWGNFGATVGPTFYAYTLHWTGNNWNTCFLICAAAMLLSGVTGLLIDARKPIVGD